MRATPSSAGRSWLPRLAYGLALLVLPAILAGAAADGSAQQYKAGAADISALTMLTSARSALGKLDKSEDAQERAIAFDQAITGLTCLYQLHGCQWALEPLVAVYRREDCPDLHVGYTRDGRLLLRVQRLELKDPVYRDWAVYLCTFESNSSLSLTARATGRLTFELRDGKRIVASALSANSVAGKKLGKLAGTFTPVKAVPSGAGQAFKQIVAIEGQRDRLAPDGISAVSLRWGKYLVQVPYYATEVRDDRRSDR